MRKFGTRWSERSWSDAFVALHKSSIVLLGRDEGSYAVEGDLIRSNCNMKNCPYETIQ